MRVNACKNEFAGKSKIQLKYARYRDIGERCSATKMVERVNRGGKVATNLLKDPDNYGKGGSRGRTQCPIDRDELKFD